MATVILEILVDQVLGRAPVIRRLDPSSLLGQPHDLAAIDYREAVLVLAILAPLLELEACPRLPAGIGGIGMARVLAPLRPFDPNLERLVGTTAFLEQGQPDGDPHPPRAVRVNHPQRAAFANV